MSDQPIDKWTAPQDPAGCATGRRLDRSFSRQVFREMIVMQIDDGPLPRRQRRALVRFAKRLGIGAAEARLVIRAVEYELGLAEPAAMDDRHTPAETNFVRFANESIRHDALPLAGPIAVIATLLIAWLITAQF